MKITYKGDYALKAMFQLALNNEKGALMSIGEIARLGDMPEKFLEQILLTLNKGGFVVSKRGIKGGFALARPPSAISVGDIVRFVEGPIEPISCIGKETYTGCKDIKNCILRDVWKDVSRAISSCIDTLTFDELVERHMKKRQVPAAVTEYSI